MSPVRPMLCLALAALSACSRPSEEQRLRQAVAALESAVEARDVGAVRHTLAPDFIGPEGLDRMGAVRLAQLEFLQHHEIGVHPGPLQVELRGDHATVRFDAALTGGSGNPLPDAARVYSVETGWRLEGGEWQLTSATWTGRLPLR